MLKFTKILLSAMIMCIPFVLIACGGKDAKFESMAVKAGTIQQTYVEGSTINYNNLVVVVTYSDKSTKEIKSSGLEYTTIDTSIVGVQTMTITYNDGKVEHSIEYDIEIVARDAISYVLEIESPSYLSDFNSNQTTGGYLSPQKQEAYYVGSANNFVYRPEVTAVTMDNNVIILNEYVSDSFVELKNDNTYQILSSVNDYVVVNDNTQEFNFTQDAVGKTFRINVTIDGYVPMEGNQYSAMEVKVVDAWNVYSAKDLYAFDDRDVSQALRQQYGIDNTVSGLVLQSNIQINKEDILDDFLFSDEDWEKIAKAKNEAQYNILVENNIDGTLKDKVSLFERTLDKNETFTIYGNYYTISSEKIPYATIDTTGDFIPGGINGHSQLFYAVGTNDVTQEENYKNNTSFVVNNISFLGNANKSNAGEGTEELLSTVKAGGIRLVKVGNTNTEFNNTIVRSHYISFLANHDGNTYEISQANAKTTLNYVIFDDSYNSNIYSWGGGLMYINNSSITNAGGPAIIADHVYNKNSETVDDGIICEIIVNNSTIESFVNGTESWFKQMNATEYVSLFQAVSIGVIQPQSNNTKTLAITKDGYPYINIQCLFKHSSAESATSLPIRGKLTIDGVKVIDFEEEDMVFKAMSAQASANGAPLFTVDAQNTLTSAIGNIASDGRSGSLISAQGALTADSPFFDTNASEIGLYFPIEKNQGFMGIALGYFNVAQN